MDTNQQLVNALAGLGSTITEAMDVIEGFVPCGHPALTVSNALVALDADDDAALAQQLETVEALSTTLAKTAAWPPATASRSSSRVPKPICSQQSAR